MARLIRRSLLGAGLVGAAGMVAWGGWRWRTSGSGLLDFAYGTDPRQTLDIWLPQGKGPFPLVVDIHGGAFRVGDKADTPPSPQVLAAGIAVVRVNYRLTDTAIWPAQGKDCLAAVAWLQQTGAAHRLDPARIALWGQSAGAFLAVSTALSMTEMGMPPKGVVSFYAPTDFSTEDADMAALGRTAAMGQADGADSPESTLLGYAVASDRVAARAMGPVGRLDAWQGPLPPILIRHGDADPMISDLQARRLRDAWLKADPGAEVDYALVAGAGHGGGGFEKAEVMGPTVAFLQRVLG